MLCLGIGVWSLRLWSSQTGLEQGSCCRRAPRRPRQLLEAGGEQSREQSVPVCPSPVVTHGIAMRRRRLRAGAAPLCLGISRGSRLPFAPGASHAGVGCRGPMPRVFPVLLPSAVSLPAGAAGAALPPLCDNS